MLFTDKIFLWLKKRSLSPEYLFQRIFHYLLTNINLLYPNTGRILSRNSSFSYSSKFSKFGKYAKPESRWDGKRQYSHNEKLENLSNKRQKSRSRSKHKKRKNSSHSNSIKKDSQEAKDKLSKHSDSHYRKHKYSKHHKHRSSRRHDERKSSKYGDRKHREKERSRERERDKKHKPENKHLDIVKQPVQLELEKIKTQKENAEDAQIQSEGANQLQKEIEAKVYNEEISHIDLSLNKSRKDSLSKDMQSNGNTVLEDLAKKTLTRRNQAQTLTKSSTSEQAKLLQNAPHTQLLNSPQLIIEATPAHKEEPSPNQNKRHNELTPTRELTKTDPISKRGSYNPKARATEENIRVGKFNDMLKSIIYQENSAEKVKEHPKSRSRSKSTHNKPEEMRYSRSELI